MDSMIKNNLWLYHKSFWKGSNDHCGSSFFDIIKTEFLNLFKGEIFFVKVSFCQKNLKNPGFENEILSDWMNLMNEYR
jgi:hypothetical protein